MKIRRLYFIAISIIVFHYCLISGQQVRTVPADTTAAIGDSSIVSDTTTTKKGSKNFFVNFTDDERSVAPERFSISKKEIDFTDYRYTGNILNYLPFGQLRDLGSSGTPSEPQLFGFGYGNFSLLIDDLELSNSWNNSSDLNRTQSESIHQLSIIPIHKAFTYGFMSNPSAIIVMTNDTIKRKPLSRIRYYQSPNEEGFIDAFFSARVLSRLVMALRVTNHSIDSLYGNTEYGAWKLRLKGIYKLGDSLYTSLILNHRKLNTPLSGGIDIESVLENSPSEFDLYSATNPVVNNKMENESTLNSVSGSIYGDILPWGLTTFSLKYIENEEVLRFLSDSGLVKETNYYKTLRSLLSNKSAFNNFTISVHGGYELIDNKLGSLESEKDLHNYFGAFSIDLNLFDDSLIPSLFGKYSNFNEQQSTGFGGEVYVSLWNTLKLNLGYADFNKPYNLVETEYIDKSINQKFNNLFSSLAFKSGLISSSISYYRSDIENFAIPVLNSDNTESRLEEIVFTTGKAKFDGMNLNSSIELWNTLLEINTNYTFNSTIKNIEKDEQFYVNAGIFYVDTLFNDNLNLKTGFKFYYNDNPNHYVYDFRKMRSSYLTSRNGIIEKLNLRDVLNDKFRLDFYLAGRIQDSATFYLIYENILGNQYFIVPYYPMPEGGIRIGLSWDFLD